MTDQPRDLEPSWSHVGCRPGRLSPLHPALWQRAVSRCWRQLVVSAVVAVLFGWAFVWLTSMFEWAAILEAMPDFLLKGLGKDVGLYATKAGQVSFLFHHPIIQLICFGWAIARGSDVVAGEISRGTMEHLLTLPARRIMVFLAPSLVAVAGAAILAAATWAGLSLGLLTVERFADLSPARFLASAVNLFAMIFCVLAFTTLFSAMDHDRWRAIWRATGLFLFSMIVFTVGFLWPAGWWLKCCVFHGAYQPQTLALKAGEVWTLPLGPLGGIAWPVAVWFNLVLLVLGLAFYVAAAMIFVKRDIPIPR